jgi:ribosome maturation factor RimP
MCVAHEKLDGLDRERVLEAVIPVLRAHAVHAVELVWRTDRSGWLLELTLERPETRIPGEGITIELCTDVSRDVSAALDVGEVISQRYRLEVGSPGLERALYSAHDYERFAGQFARLKLKEAHAGQHVLRGTLQGLDEAGRVSLNTEQGEVLTLPLEGIESARLVFQMAGASERGGKGSPARASSRRSKTDGGKVR